jgi:hypothetical protein
MARPDSGRSGTGGRSILTEGNPDPPRVGGRERRLGVRTWTSRVSGVFRRALRMEEPSVSVCNVVRLAESGQVHLLTGVDDVPRIRFDTAPAVGADGVGVVQVAHALRPRTDAITSPLGVEVSTPRSSATMACAANPCQLREPCRALAPIFKTCGPASPFRRSGYGIDLRALGGVLRKLSERHLANHELPRSDLFAHVLEPHLVPFPISLEGRLHHLRSVGLPTLGARSESRVTCEVESASSTKGSRRRTPRALR